jgi:hypothetical protein
METFVGLLCDAERVTGIEPVFQPWEGRVLPLNHTRIYCVDVALELAAFTMMIIVSPGFL